MFTMRGTTEVIEARRRSHELAMEDQRHAGFCSQTPCGGDASLLHEIERLEQIALKCGGGAAACGRVSVGIGETGTCAECKAAGS